MKPHERPRRATDLLDALGARARAAACRARARRPAARRRWPDRRGRRRADCRSGVRDARLLDLRERLFGPDITVVAACPALRRDGRVELSRRRRSARRRGAARRRQTRSSADGYVITLPPADERRPARAGARRRPAPARARAIAARALRDRRPRRRRIAGGRRRASRSRSPPRSRRAWRARSAGRRPARLPLSGVRQRLGRGLRHRALLWSEIHAWARQLLRDVHALARAYGWREADILALSPTRRGIYLELLGVMSDIRGSRSRFRGSPRHEALGARSARAAPAVALRSPAPLAAFRHGDADIEEIRSDDRRRFAPSVVLARPVSTAQVRGDDSSDATRQSCREHADPGSRAVAYGSRPRCAGTGLSRRAIVDGAPADVRPAAPHGPRGFAAERVADDPGRGTPTRPPRSDASAPTPTPDAAFRSRMRPWCRCREARPPHAHRGDTWHGGPDRCRGESLADGVLVPRARRSGVSGRRRPAARPRSRLDARPGRRGRDRRRP